MERLVSRVALAALYLAVFASCGNVPPNSQPDAATADAPGPSVVKATVLSFLGDGAPDLTAKLLFTAPDGAVVFDGAVDAQGRAEAMLPLGGSVTAIRVTIDTPGQLVANLTTIAGVKPGDNLTFGSKPPGTILNQGGQTTMTANFTPLPTTLTPASYTFYTACGPTTLAATPPPTSVQLSFRDSCHDNNFDLVGVAAGGMLTAPLFVRLTNVAYQSGGTFTIPVGFAAAANFTVNMTNIPDLISTMTLSRSSMIDSVPVAPMSTPAGVDPPAGAHSISVPYPAAFGTRSQVTINMSRADALGVHSYETHTASLLQPLAVDLGKQLPWLSGFAIRATGGTWSVVAPGEADGMVALWQGRWIADARSVTITWRIAQPFGMTGFTFPKLPSVYANLDPGQQTVAVTSVIGQVTTVDYDTVNGYDEFRRSPETLVAPVASLGAFVNMPFQRQISTIAVKGLPGAN
jgi:hypothetical protein